MDINQKIDIERDPASLSGSRLTYYKNTEDEVTVAGDIDKISKAMICLVGRSTLGAIQKTIALYSTVKLRNINPLE